jgi:hypothetical protein
MLEAHAPHKDIHTWTLQTVNAFDSRFNHSARAFPLFAIERAPDPDRLTPARLNEYQTLIATLINATDVVMERMRLVTTECRAILNGARDEDALIKAVTSMLAAPPSESHP